jgi:hypothetical protein
MSSGQGSRLDSSAIELALGAGALAMAVGAFAGHALAPDRVADHYGWVRDRWYQREIGAFNAGLGYGGDRRGVWNLATVAEDAALGIGGLMLLRRDRIAQ